MLDRAAAVLLQDTPVHATSVALHVLLGTAALGLGAWQLIARKGDARHRRTGRWFLACLSGTVGTAAIGILAFGFRPFLAVLTLFAAYLAFAGYRTVRTRARGPASLDALGSLAGLTAAVLLMWHVARVRVPWSPVVIYSTLAGLVTVGAYDLLRFAFPRRWFAILWRHEHVVKMIGAFNATLSAFAGTVLAGFQPYSQLLPSVVCSALMAYFVIRLRRQSREESLEST